MIFRTLISVTVLSCVGLVDCWGEEPVVAEPVSFNAQIRPIFTKHCVACHGGVKQASGLSFIYRDKALGNGDSGAPAIVPGKPEQSYLIERVSSTDESDRMPPAEHGPALSAREIGLLRKWIEQGAHWELHWSFAPPKQPALPPVQESRWCRDELDHFVLAKIESVGLSPAEEATRAQWLRRVSFGLTGLPPTPDELQAFLTDSSAPAFEKVVDRLLASPRFGERWASLWLDLARYADTKGFERDPGRDVWPYRDWLIRALNADMPYDQFTIRQLAGDLLPDASLDDRLATTFHRNTQTNTEGGTDDEEFRTVAVLDRANTTWQVWQGITFGCTQCHSHPYDPIEHEEYYQFVAFFNNTRDCDVDEEYPVVAVPKLAADRERATRLDRELHQVESQVHEGVMKIATQGDTWQPLALASAQSTGSAEMRIESVEGHSELAVEGTISVHSKYTIETLPIDSKLRVQALRIDALPTDEADAMKNSELGFVVSRIKVFLVAADGKESELLIREVYSDESHPILNPDDSLDDNPDGWGEYPKVYGSHLAVFLFDEAVEVPAGSRLRLEIKQDRVTVGDHPLVIQRARFSISAAPAWRTLLDSEAHLAARQELKDLREERKKLGGPLIPVMVERPTESRRRQFVFTRGNWRDKDYEVSPGIPQLFGVQTKAPTRLEMAQWIAARENPLTARVQVNRIWEQLFGRGIVETVEDLGTSGTLPSHPELLDFLSVRFMDEQQWSLKQLLRSIVLSATFRQSSQTTPEHLAKDPQNRFLARGPRQRLRAEMIRDQALVLSGNLSDKMYGPPVKPPQPEGIWRSVYSGEGWETSSAPERYRRAVYIYWKRTSPYPSLMAFDATSREVCTARRIATNTPLQALVTLNDLAFLELAKGYAARMARLEGTTAQKIATGYCWATGHPPREEIVDRLVKLHDTAIKNHPTTRDALPEEEHFALTIVANALFNLDEVLTQ